MFWVRALRGISVVCGASIQTSFSSPSNGLPKPLRVVSLKPADVPRSGPFFLEVYAPDCHTCKMAGHVMSQVEFVLSSLGSAVKVHSMDEEDYRASSLWADKTKPIDVPYLVLHSNRTAERYTGPFMGSELLQWINKRHPLNLPKALELCNQVQDETIESIYLQACEKVRESAEVYPVLMWRSPCGQEFLWAHMQQLGFLPPTEPRMLELTQCMATPEYRAFWHKVLRISKAQGTVPTLPPLH